MIYIMRVSYGQIISIILVILLIYIIYKIYEKYNKVTETFDGNPSNLGELTADNVYGYNEYGEPFKFYLTPSDEIVPYIWRKDISDNSGWCHWYGEDMNGELYLPEHPCNNIDISSTQLGDPNILSWDDLVDASADYLSQRFEEDIDLFDRMDYETNSGLTLLNLFNNLYAQPKYFYKCTHPNEASCNDASAAGLFVINGNDDCSMVTTEAQNPGFCWKPDWADPSYIPYFHRYENPKRGFFEKNKVGAALSSLSGENIYDVIYSTTDEWREGTQDIDISFYMGWDEEENNKNLPTQILNRDGIYGYNIIKDEEPRVLPINRAASSVLTYNPGLKTFCGNVCFNGNDHIKVDGSLGVIDPFSLGVIDEDVSANKPIDTSDWGW